MAESRKKRRIEEIEEGSEPVGDMPDIREVHEVQEVYEAGAGSASDTGGEDESASEYSSCEHKCPQCTGCQDVLFLGTTTSGPDEYFIIPSPVHEGCQCAPFVFRRGYVSRVPSPVVQRILEMGEANAALARSFRLVNMDSDADADADADADEKL